MKPLITTQLIEEYQKELSRRMNEQESGDYFSESEVKQLALIKDFITSLQSKQSEERQNIVDAVDNAINTTLNSNSNIVLSGEDYFNQTFKQEEI